VVLLDFSKAFDKVNHEKLIQKLIYYGFPLNLVKFVSKFLFGRTQRVLVGDSLSSCADVGSGVPQGTVLGPLLFSVYINDLLIGDFDSNVVAFADDIKVYGVDPTSVQNDILCINKWCSLNDMSLNIQKCKVLHFGSSNPCTVYNIDGVPIGDSSSERDLGFLSILISRLVHTLIF
jgi:hypothetical protein